MTPFIIFVTLLAVQFANGVSETIVPISFNRRFELEVKSTGNPAKCKLITNKGEEFEFEPKRFSRQFLNDRIVTTDFLSKPKCSVEVRTGLSEDIGEWNIISYLNKTAGKDKLSDGSDNFVVETFTFKVYLENKEVSLTSTNNVYSVVGHYVYATINRHIENLTGCFVKRPNENYTDMLLAKEKDFKNFGQCGFQTLIKNSTHDDGIWSVRAVENNRIVYTTGTVINVREEEKPETDQKTIKLKRGEVGYIILPAEVIFCQMEDPRGTILPLTRKRCEYKISVVTTNHEGNWTARYGVQGNMNVFTQKFRVVTYENKAIVGTVTRAENKKVQLYCHLHNNHEMILKYCSYTRPDGVSLNLLPGLGTEEYSAFNISDMDYRQLEAGCGLIIHNLKPHDYGIWKCSLGINNNNNNDEYSGTLLHVDESILHATKYFNENQDKLDTIQAENLYVKRNESFEIKCSVLEVLNYCGLRSPNGTIYSVSYNAEFKSPFSLPYEGSGLSLGECGARIDRAVDTDEGEWTCNMGVFNSTEKRQTQLVIITDSYIIPEVTGIMVNNNGNNLDLSCRILPNVVDRDILYWRWIRPDGYGIYNSVRNRYITTRNRTQSRLSILNVDFNEDVGRWTCVAGLQGSNLEEESANIHITIKVFTMSALIGISTGILAFLAMAIFVYVLIRVLRKRAVPKPPPAYNYDSCMPPKYVDPECVRKEFQY